jgi:hypothetical protein
LKSHTSPAPRRWSTIDGFVCAECARQPRPDENAADDWRAYSYGVGELVVFCPECAEREFGADLDEKSARG